MILLDFIIYHLYSLSGNKPGSKPNAELISGLILTSISIQLTISYMIVVSLTFPRLISIYHFIPFVGILILFMFFVYEGLERWKKAVKKFDYQSVIKKKVGLVSILLYYLINPYLLLAISWK